MAVYFSCVPKKNRCADWNAEGPRVRQSRPLARVRCGEGSRATGAARRCEMPFDGINGFENHPIVKLGRGGAVARDRAAMVQGSATRRSWSPLPGRRNRGRGGRQVLQKPILQAAREVSGKRYWRIEFFNDDPRTTHADVLEVLRHARENMIAGMIGEAHHRQPRRLQVDARASDPVHPRRGRPAHPIRPSSGVRLSFGEPGLRPHASWTRAGTPARRAICRSVRGGNAGVGGADGRTRFRGAAPIS